MPHALITGASQGFGRALLAALVERGWVCTVDARDAAALHAATADLAGVRGVPGDVADARHRAALVATSGDRLDLLVHNASTLGPSPLPPLAVYPLDALRRVYETNVIAPLALTQLALPALLRTPAPTVVTLSSNAAVEAYQGWGGYGSAKAALDHVAAVLAVEHPDLRVYAFDPGDMRTAMHQAAFPGEDISDRPEPATVVPALLRLLDRRPGSGRHRAADLLGSDPLVPDLLGSDR
jgi:NAD(P)-dependent dehydrogenase (short-subunit alcohol dehydrogenase family)